MNNINCSPSRVTSVIRIHGTRSSAPIEKRDKFMVPLVMFHLSVLQVHKVCYSTISLHWHHSTKAETGRHYYFSKTFIFRYFYVTGSSFQECFCASRHLAPNTIFIDYTIVCDYTIVYDSDKERSSEKRKLFLFGFLVRWSARISRCNPWYFLYAMLAQYSGKSPMRHVWTTSFLTLCNANLSQTKSFRKI